MSKVRGFSIYNRETGQKLATLPLTIPIGSTVEAYEKAGHKVRWGWDRVTMSDTILVKSKPCTVCGEYEVWSLDRQAVTRWQEGENIQNAFPDMSAKDREVLISGTHPACWDKLFPEEEADE